MFRRPVEDSLSDVGRAVSWVSEISSTIEFSADLRFAIELCLEEALANLILHGQAPDGRKDIAITFCADAGRATIQITDRCSPYDTANVALPEPRGLDDPGEGGRGLRLLRTFATELSYETTAERNTLTMIFRAAPSP